MIQVGIENEKQEAVTFGDLVQLVTLGLRDDEVNDDTLIYANVRMSLKTPAPVRLLSIGRKEK